MSLKKKVRFGVQPAGRPNSEINVTPLVDVVLVLLIIFMVVTPLLEKDIEVRVPDDTEEVSQDEVPPNQLVVALDAAGNITINNEKIAEGDYENRLHRMLNARPDDKTVFFTADDRANYGKLVNALDGAKKAGASPLGMVTEPMPAAAAAAPGGAPPAPPPPAP
jgi:biopolymer transport protein ExbD